ncbi:hypothetical protein [Methylobacterium durans]|uniref:Uncharacterized protein n=1 Tax=Methylobacterium durans TaxID=2202825 RepID=A0A2U8WC90_9HYPH|nr:hypothetical protein [Methylobacterium durans]AWN43775.1 hypothetical protein DK389_28745 [Methylobacterium durans]
MSTQSPCTIMDRLVVLLTDERILRGDRKYADLFLQVSALLAEAMQTGADQRTLTAIRAALAITDPTFLVLRSDPALDAKFFGRSQSFEEAQEGPTPSPTEPPAPRQSFRSR